MTPRPDFKIHMTKIRSLLHCDILMGKRCDTPSDATLINSPNSVPGPGAVVTPIWDKAEAQDVSAYDNTPYKDALAKFAKIMLDDGRSGHSPEHIGR